VQAIISLGHSLDMQVVAEGVEQEDQLAALVSLDCDLLQGYLYSRPQPEQAIRRIIFAEAWRSAQQISKDSLVHRISKVNSL
jgi:EAL domain-containing protein (putative c-di-GMP-specific phosphodiesterase class I)